MIKDWNKNKKMRDHMQYNMPIYLCVFLPAVLGGYYLTPKNTAGRFYYWQALRFI